MPRYEGDEDTLDRTFEMLADQQRRYAIEKLRATADGAASLDVLADHIVERAPEATDRTRTKIALHHETLPKLAAANVVDFDPRTGTVQYHGNEPIEDVLDFVVTRTT